MLRERRGTALSVGIREDEEGSLMSVDPDLGTQALTTTGWRSFTPKFGVQLEGSWSKRSLDCSLLSFYYNGRSIVHARYRRIGTEYFWDIRIVLQMTTIAFKLETLAQVFPDHVPRPLEEVIDTSFT